MQFAAMYPNVVTYVFVASNNIALSAPVVLLPFLFSSLFA